MPEDPVGLARLQFLNSGTVPRVTLEARLRQEINSLIVDWPYEIKAQPNGALTMHTLPQIMTSPRLMGEYFGDRSFVWRNPVPLVSEVNSTLFVSAGVQIYERWIESASHPTSQRYFVAQPVARFHDMFQARDCFHTAFINLCLEEANCTPENHISNLRIFLNFLITHGLSPKLFSFEDFGPLQQRWGHANLRSWTVGIKYNGLEIGEACYIYDIFREGSSAVVISDIGFGWERLSKCFTGRSSYANVPGADSALNASLELQDGLRTIALLVGSGVKPSPRAQGYRVRTLIRNVVEDNLTAGRDLNSDLLAYYEGWCEWAPMRLGPNAVASIFDREHIRILNHIVLARVFGETEKHGDGVETLEQARVSLQRTALRARIEQPARFSAFMEPIGQFYRHVLRTI